MIKPILALIHILKGNIKLNGQTVPLIKRSYPLDKTPCITLDDSAGSSTETKNIVNIKRHLPPNHPQYEQYKGIKMPRQAIRDKRNTTISIHIWCDTETEREKLCNQIEHLLNLAQSDHYMFCKNYSEGYCDHLESECPASETDNNIKTVKNQCPKPYEYNYRNIFTSYDLLRDTFNVDSPYPLDDLSTKTPVLRSIIKVTTSYYDYHIIGGAIPEELTFNDDLIL